jgi:hypothetical protein
MTQSLKGSLVNLWKALAMNNPGKPVGLLPNNIIHLTQIIPFRGRDRGQISHLGVDFLFGMQYLGWSVILKSHMGIWELGDPNRFIP